MERKKPKNLTAKIIRHPEWCDQQKCTATAARMPGECHLGAPLMMTLPGLLSTITVTAELSTANAPWLTDTFIKIELAGLLTERSAPPVTASATIAVGDISELLQALNDMANRAITNQETDIAEHLIAGGHHMFSRTGEAVSAR